MIRTGLVGYPLIHSYSPEIHAAAFDALVLDGEYRLYPIAPDDKGGLLEMTRRLRCGELQGLNITIPYKQAIIPLVDELTPSARAIGAVNTLFSRDGRLVGHNTDAPGFLADLARFLPISLSEQKRKRTSKGALVLGAGGAARAVVYGLLTDGWIVTMAVRRADVDQVQMLIDSFEPQAGAQSMRWIYMEKSDLQSVQAGIQLIVNSTPVGMFPETEFSPWPADLPFPHDVVVYDVIYNPRLTCLVKDARAAGLVAATGLGMLVEQAALSFTCWTGQIASREVMAAALEV
jgi:shikimate dehydrogenase